MSRGGRGAGTGRTDNTLRIKLTRDAQPTAVAVVEPKRADAGALIPLAAGAGAFGALSKLDLCVRTERPLPALDRPPAFARS